MYLRIAVTPTTAPRGSGCSSVGRASDRHAARAGWIPRCDTGLFFSHCQLPVQTFSWCPYNPRVQPHALTSVRTVKDPVVHVKVRWIMETLKHSACSVVWVARLCRSWFSVGKATRISRGRNPNGTIQLLKKKKKCSVLLGVLRCRVEVQCHTTFDVRNKSEKKSRLYY